MRYTIFNCLLFTFSKKWNIGILAHLTNEWDNLKNLKILRAKLFMSLHFALNIFRFLKLSYSFFIILGIFGYWVIGAGCLIEKDLGSSPSLPNCSKDYWKLLYLLISTEQDWWLHDLWFKRYIQKCTLTHVLILTVTSLIWYIIGWLKYKNLNILRTEHTFSTK